jgi:hypothetical protein
MPDEHKNPWWGWPLLVILLPLMAVVIAVWLVAVLLLQVVVWVTWCRRGRYALVVYSNSPIWREYFETHVMPALGGRAVVLNWSDRSRWNWSLPVVVFSVLGGSREFNPMAVVFAPFTWPRQFRFYSAFREFKHGQSEAVESLRREFFKALDDVAPETERANQ